MIIKKNHTLILIILTSTSCFNNNLEKSSYSSVNCLNTLETIAKVEDKPVLERPFWEYFEDEKLKTLEGLLVEHNKELQSEASRIQMIYDRVSYVKAQRYPQINFIFEDLYQYFSKNGFLAAITPNLAPGYQDFSIGFDFHWNFDLFGQKKFEYKALEFQAIASGFKLKKTYLDLAADLARNYTQLVILTQILDLSQKQLWVYQKLLDLNQQNISSNLSDDLVQLDLLKKQRYSQAFNDVTVNLIVATKATVCALIGAMPDEFSLESAQLVTKDFPHVTLEDLPLAVLTKRPDIQMATALLEEGKNKIKSAKAAFYPNVNLHLLAILDSISISNLFTSSSQSYTAKPVLELPIFNAGLLASNLRKEKHYYASLIHEYDNTLLKAAKDIVTSTSSFKSRKEEFFLYQEAASCEKNRTLLTKGNYEAGLKSLIDYLNAELSDIQAQLQMLEAQKSYSDAFIDLAISLGGGL